MQTIIDAIKNAAARGVKVRIINDATFLKNSEKTLEQLHNINNIETRIIPFEKLAGGVMHAKYMIVDGENCFIVFKYEPKDKDDIFGAFLAPKKEPETEEEKMLSQYVKRTYLEILSILSIDNPTKHSEILEKIGLRPFEKEPDYREEAFIFWSAAMI